jgi:hypothetical protein
MTNNSDRFGSFDLPYRCLPPDVVKCEPRNSWESFNDSLLWSTRDALNSSMITAAYLAIFATLFIVAIRFFPQQRRKYVAFIMGLSGLSAAAFTLASLSYPSAFKPLMVGLGAFLASGALLAALEVLKKNN